MFIESVSFSFRMDAAAIIKSVKNIENFYRSYYKENWEKFISCFHSYMLNRGFLAEYKGRVRIIFS